MGGSMPFPLYVDSAQAKTRQTLASVPRSQNQTPEPNGLRSHDPCSDALILRPADSRALFTAFYLPNPEVPRPGIYLKVAVLQVA